MKILQWTLAVIGSMALAGAGYFLPSGFHVERATQVNAPAAKVYEESPAGTRVTWTNAGDVGPNPLKHYLAWQMDRMVGPDFEQGLGNLKALVEKP